MRHWAKLNPEALASWEASAGLRWGKHHFLHFQMVQCGTELQQSTDVNRQLITHLFNKMYSTRYLSSEPLTNYTVHRRALINKI